MSTITFAIESSCDETSAAVLRNGAVISNIVSSQYFHKEYGGIVPELASRAHIQVIDEIVTRAFKDAGIDKDEVSLMAASQGPGLIGSLLVGYNYAKGFALSRDIPFMGIDHIESHLFSCFIGQEEINFPFIALVVSGGHTILFLVESYLSYKILGNTHDDAAGEAFDKVAKMLGLEYPGGPLIDKLASTGNPQFHKFPKSIIKGSPYDFSFSGIKTSVLYFLKNNYPVDKTNLPLNDIAASFQSAVTGSLIDKTIRAAKDHNIKTIAVSGGVSANSGLRNGFLKYEKEGYSIYFPEKIYSTDNAAMIGYNAYLKFKASVGNAAINNVNPLLSSAYARFKYQQ
ncbi:MAG TPA: tRNA (adenosine(37)-N6)-threonylcarbamoyltransferase complex transferase subunit TsaD [Ignavibacteria bacterium]|nr:tRNA (adenosine(37)-N6)-threonylcarbamoyltransferase complex transferase subunit TsaD [Ignavibacteria bacterium]HMQ98561.1 tRNA (adenosine(37)-N6)-threonylcarbamoyltransferase complex transferase subunit TsaD [Ignavibacteria bacterium]